MKKYRLCEKTYNEVLPYFIHGGYIDKVTLSEIDSVINYIDKRAKDGFILIDPGFNVIAIIDQLRQTCYIYSNCGINFNLDDFVDGLFKYQKHFSAIVCDQALYHRLKEYLYDDNLIFEKTKSVYTTNAKDLLKLEVNRRERQKKSILLSKLAFEILYNPFLKILDETHIFLINHRYSGVLTVNNSEVFINIYYKLQQEQFKVYLNENDFVEGNLYNGKKNVFIYDLDEAIESIVIIRNAQTCNEVVYADSVFNDFTQEFKLTIENLKLNEAVFYLIDTENFPYQTLLSLTFTLSNQKTYFYYYHTQSNLNTNIPELNQGLKEKQNPTGFILKFSLVIAAFIPSLLFNYFFPQKEYFFYYILISLFMLLAVFLPILFLKQEKFSYHNQALKTTQYKISWQACVILLITIAILILMRFS